MLYLGRPLTEYIKHYETLNYDPSELHAQHERVRRDSQESEPVNLDFKAHGRLVVPIWSICKIREII